MVVESERNINAKKAGTNDFQPYQNIGLVSILSEHQRIAISTFYDPASNAHEYKKPREKPTQSLATERSGAASRSFRAEDGDQTRSPQAPPATPAV